MNSQKPLPVKSFLYYLTIFSVFLAVFSQGLFTSEKNVIFANILSFGILLTFIFNWLKGKKITFSKPIFSYFCLLIFFAISILWRNDFAPLNTLVFRTFLLVSIFLLTLSNSLKWYSCGFAVRWAFMAITIVNFLIYISGTRSTFWGNTYFLGEVRFQGSFENPNTLALVSFISLIFAFKDISHKKTIIRFISWAVIPCVSILILATASKKGLLALIFSLAVFLPVHLKRLSWDNKIKAFASLAILIVISFTFSKKLNLDKRWDHMVFRMENFTETFDTASSVNGNSTSQRKFFIHSGFQGFLKSPLWGHGVDSFRTHRDHQGLYSHNNYIELLYNGGLIAFCLFYYWYYYLFKQALKIKNKEQRLLILFPLLFLLSLDMAYVSFSMKIVLYTLVLFESDLRNLPKKLDLK